MTKRTDTLEDQRTVKLTLKWMIDKCGYCPYSHPDDGESFSCLRRPFASAPSACSYIDWLTCPVGGLAQALHPPQA